MKPYKKCYPALREQLKSIGMTYAELAYRMGRSEPHVKRIMVGLSEPRIGEARRMLQIAGMPVSRFTEVFLDED